MGAEVLSCKLYDRVGRFKLSSGVEVALFCLSVWRDINCRKGGPLEVSSCQNFLSICFFEEIIEDLGKHKNFAIFLLITLPVVKDFLLVLDSLLSGSDFSLLTLSFLLVFKSFNLFHEKSQLMIARIDLIGQILVALEINPSSPSKLCGLFFLLLLLFMDHIDIPEK